MKDYVAVLKDETSVQVCFYIDEVMAIGEKIEEINEEAYMNGYNWEALLSCYLEENEPDLLEGLEHDPEADMYVAFYSLTPENEARAEKFAEIIQSLIEKEEDLYEFVRRQGDQIEWD